MGNYTIMQMFENPRRSRQAKHFTTNVPKILDLKSSFEQIFSENCRWVHLFQQRTCILREEKKDFVAFFNCLDLSQVIMLSAAPDEGQLVLRSNRNIGQLNSPIFQPFYQLAFVIFTVCFWF